ncbi:magnesium transporter NIPA-domain-containing protein [Mycena sp. CBHHK59/15]|nr:magnesium transporter NIPA-domain-containing protein [Mycena sp. CBHHK59/15]
MASAHPLVACYPELDLSPAPSHVLDLGNKLPELTTGTVIGITVAITGNVLISLALNLQKLAHKRREAHKRRDRQAKPTVNGTHPNGISAPEEPPRPDGAIPDNAPLAAAVLAPLPQRSDYGSTSRSGSDTTLHEMGVTPQKSLLSRLFRSKQNWALNGALSERTTLLPVDVVTEEQVMCSRLPKKNSEDDEAVFEDGNESDYLKSKVWWLGFLLMNVGELGNFISYAWAPASVVAPLGTFALMANCVFAPLMLGERFRKRDILGIVIAVIGAVTVVLASNASDTRLDPNALLVAISQPPFIVYSCVYIAGIIILSILSQGKAGKQWVFVDVGLCALFGGFTVLSTKAVSTLLTMEWFEMFTEWITYPVIAVLILTGVGQIRYLNRALMRFDGKVVIPIQFVLFTMSAIVGSAILYGDFKKASFHQLVTFLYGCAATFTGIFIIAWEPQQGEPEDAETTPVEADADGTDSEEDDEHPMALGTPGRRKRPTLALASGHGLIHKQSPVGILGLSPARPLLMVHTPPREIPDRFRDIEREPQTSIPGSARRRAISWMGDEVRGDSGRNGSVGRFSLASAGLPRSDTTGDTVGSPEDNRR